jgi:hypothetical protein
MITHTEKKVRCLEEATAELFKNGVEITAENLYYFLCGMQDVWISDEHTSDEKTLWLAALRAAIHDRLNEMEVA